MFFHGTIELLLILQLSGARLSLQIDGLLEGAFTHTHKHTHTHTCTLSLAGLVKTPQHLLLLEAYEFTSRLPASLEIT